MDEATARAEKLRLLKERAQAKRQREAEGGEGGEEDGAPVLKFRNYKPKTDDLKEAVLPKPAVVKSLDTGGLGEAKNLDVQLDVAPKKPNWDLKREIQKKLDKLERRTQNAIIELIKEKVAEGEGRDEGSQGAEDSGKALVAAVSGRA